MSKYLTSDDVRSPPAFETSEENLADLLLDCHTFLAELLARRQAKWVERDARHLLGRLGTLVDWETVH